MGWLTNVLRAVTGRTLDAHEAAVASIIERDVVHDRRAANGRASLARGGQVIGHLSLWEQFQRIGGGLTPERVSQIIRLADVGDMTQLMDLANDARQKDCHLQSVLLTSEEAVAGLAWELVEPKKPNRKEKKIVEWLDATLRARDGIDGLIAHQTGGRYYGYAVSEILYGKEKGLLVPVHYEPVAPRRFGFNIETGAFIWRDLGMEYEGVDFRAVYPNKFVVSQPRVTGDVPCREGLVRVLMWAALFRNWSLSDWLRLGEIAWKPWRTGTYQKGASKEDIAALWEALEELTASGIAALPETTGLKVEWPAGTAGKSSAHGEVFDKMASEMSKAVLGQTLTTEQGKVGSQALGNVQNEVRKDLRDASAKGVAGDLNRDLVTPLVRLNYGTKLRPPALRFITEDVKDITSFGTGVKNLKEAGTRIPQSWVRDQAGIPEPKDDEPCLGDGAPKPPAPPKEDPNGNEEDDEGEAPPEPGDEGDDAA